MRKLLILFITILFASCNNADNQHQTASAPAAIVAGDNGSNSAAAEVVIESMDEGGWGADIRLSITDITRTPLSTIYKVQALHQNEKIGFDIILPVRDPAGKEKIAQELSVISTGENSDNLLAFLTGLYKQPVDTAKRFTPEIRISFIDLNEFAKAQLGTDPGYDPDSEVRELKLFFESANGNDYAELYININEKMRWIGIREKDEEYRANVIRHLTKK